MKGLKDVIKYRAMRDDNCTWCYGLPAYDAKGDIGEMEIFPDASEFISIIPETLGRFALVKDITETDIYEGDIIISKYQAVKGIVRHGVHLDTSGIARYGFYVEWEGDPDLRNDWYYWATKLDDGEELIEVIDNIYRKEANK